MEQVKTRINKYQPILRIPKKWINPPGEKRTKIPVVIEYLKDKITINKIQPQINTED